MVKKSNQDMNMASKPSVAITKECLTLEWTQKDVKIHSDPEPLRKMLFGNGNALVQEEEGIEKHRRTPLWVITPTTDIHQSRSIFANPSVGMHDGRT